MYQVYLLVVGEEPKRIDYKNFLDMKKAERHTQELIESPYVAQHFKGKGKLILGIEEDDKTVKAYDMLGNTEIAPSIAEKYARESRKSAI